MKRVLNLFLALAVGGLGSEPLELLRQAESKIKAEQFEAAEPLLAKALKLDPGNTDILYRLGYSQFRQRKLGEARRNFEAVVKSAPPAYYSRYFLGRIALLLNEPKSAVAWLEPVVVARQAIFDVSSQLASAYAGAGMREKAVGALETAIAEAPWDASLYYRLGRLYSELGRNELGADAFENSRRLRSATREDVEKLMLVSQLLSEGKRSEADAAATDIRTREDADPNALVALGVIYGGANLQAQALDAFDRAAARDPNFFQAQHNRGLALLKVNRAAEALAPLTRAVELLPQSVDANRAYGLAAVMNQKYREAAPALERVWRADPTDVRAGALLATAYLRTGEAAKAVEVLAGETMRSSSEPAALLLRVEALNAAEDPNGALAAAEDARKRLPQLPQAHLAVAQQLARLGRYSEARPAFAEALKRAPGLPEAELGLADTLSRGGEHEEALTHYRAATRLARTSLAARTGLARSLTALRHFDEARQVLEEAIAAHPGEAVLHVELSRVYARLGKPDLAAEQTRMVERLRKPQ
jgi:cellulose synthase operon protein C